MTCPDCKGEIRVQIISEPRKRSGILYAIIALAVIGLLVLLIPFLAAIPAAFLILYYIFDIPENRRVTFAVCQQCGFFLDLKDSD